ncbi:MAG TPA: class I adenylate-forming enzyme family protein [Burkholderiales bacterium]|nr:class I adenylate-forming enzyme family protein [Burkholderiales bacterium]
MIPFSAETIRDYTNRGVWGRTTVDDLFRIAVLGGRERLAIVDPPDKQAMTGVAPLRLNWLELDDMVDRLAARFLALGLKKDDIVAVQLPNCVELAMVYLAVARLGLIISPFPIQYRDHELIDLLGFVDARVMITFGRIKGHDHVAMLAGVKKHLPGLKGVLAWGASASEAQSLDAQSLDNLREGVLDRAAVLDASRAAAVDANEVFTITWTSGTEARPKGVPKTHNHWMCAGIACAEAGELRDGEVLLNPFPMTHIGSLGGMFFPWLLKGGVLVQHQPFELDTFLTQLASERVAYTVAPPAVLNLLVQNQALMDKYDLSALHSVGSGSAPLSPWMIRGLFDRYGISVWNSFGSSEGCALFGAGRDIPDPEARAEYLPRFGVKGIGWSSWVAGAQETRLVDPATEQEITQPGQPGELRLRGPLVFSGYWNDPEQTRRAFDADGWYKTGDTFEIAGEGPTPRYYHYLARTKDVVNRGGMKISPAELETLIDGHPKVREAAVIGVPDARMGEVVCAVVVPRDPAAKLELKELTDYLRDKRIAVYKLPERLAIVDALPRNPVGKVLKRDLRDQFAKSA